jgi:hypothetical protein
VLTVNDAELLHGVGQLNPRALCRGRGRTEGHAEPMLTGVIAGPGLRRLGDSIREAVGATETPQRRHRIATVEVHAGRYRRDQA